MNKFIILIMFLIGCASNIPNGKTKAEVLFKQANSLVESSRYLMAIEKLNTIRSKYPYSIYASKSELKLADILFKQESFAEAAASYIVFRDFHPKYKNIEYVISRIADSFYNQIPSSVDRDLSAAYEAIKYYKEVLRISPKSKSAKEASLKINKSLKKIEEKEVYIGDYYFKTNSLKAAIFRYKHSLRTVKNKDLRDHIYQRIVKSFVLLGNKKLCLSSAKEYSSLISQKNYKMLDNLAQSCSKI